MLGIEVGLGSVGESFLLYLLVPIMMSISRGLGSCLPFPRPPRLIVPTNASAPTIDGYINDEEWVDAVSFVGLVDGDTGILSDKEFIGFLKSDGENLYFAFRMKIHSSEILVREKTSRDSDVYYDDSWELFFYPGGDEHIYYHLVVNSLGTVLDSYGGDISWDGRWKIMQNFGASELEVPDLWEAEVSIPLKDLGYTREIEGSECRFGFFVNQKTPDLRSFGWTPQMGLFAQPERAAILRFEASKSIVGIESLGRPGSGVIAPVVKFMGEPQEVLSLLRLSSGEEIKRTVSLSGEPFQFPPMQGKGEALLSIISPVSTEANFHYSTLIEYDSTPLLVKAVNYPSRKELCLDIDYVAFEKRDEAKQYLIELGTKSKSYERGSKFPKEQIHISTADVLPGEYGVRVSLFDKKGKDIVSRTVRYTKEGNEPWLDNKIGIVSGHVPTPYTPLKVKNRTAGCIGRKIELGESGLPWQIRSNGLNLLEEPVRLQGNFNGKNASLQAIRPFKFTDIQPDDSIGSAEVSFGHFKGRLEMVISFDGFCWYELNLFLEKRVKAKDVAIEIRLPRDIAKSYMLAGVDFKKTALVSEETTGDVLNKDMALPFMPHVWLGNDKAGLAWMAESHEGWQVVNDRKVVELLARKDSVLMRINIIDEPIELSGELKLSFGLQASPVKPITRRQQRYIFVNFVNGIIQPYISHISGTEGFGLYQGHRKGCPTFNAYAGLPEPSQPEHCIKEVERQKQMGVNCTPYSVITWLSRGLPEMETYRGDWGTGNPWPSTAGGAANPEPFELCDTEDKNYRDFIVWRFMKNWDAYGGTSVYYDLFSPGQNKSAEHKRGYRTRVGETAYPWSIRSVREIARRLYIAYRKQNPDFSVFGNAGGGFWLPLVAFVDAVCGQHTNHANMYPEMLLYDRYRSAFYGYHLGVKTLFLPNLKSSAWIARTELSSYLVGIIFNHNTTFWLAFCDYAAVLPYLRIYHQGDWPVQEFFPYWRYPNLTDLDPGKFKVSGWFNEKAEEGLLCIASLEPESVAVPVKLGKDWKFKGVNILTDACRDELELNEYEYYTYPGGPEPTTFVGKYSELQKAGKISATYDDGIAAFKPYGVLMLHVK